MISKKEIEEAANAHLHANGCDKGFENERQMEKIAFLAGVQFILSRLTAPSVGDVDAARNWIARNEGINHGHAEEPGVRPFLAGCVHARSESQAEVARLKEAKAYYDRKFAAGIFMTCDEYVKLLEERDAYRGALENIEFCPRSISSNVVADMQETARQALAKFGKGK